jgi:hypothetical protein
MEIGTGSQADSTALRSALAGLSDEALSRLRVSSDVPGRRGPHVSATQLIQVVTRTSQPNASQAWSRLKEGGFLDRISNPVVRHRFPGRGGESEVVDIPTALQIIMALPGKTAATVRLRASVLLVRFLAGDLTLVGEIYGMNQLQDYLREHDAANPLRLAAAARDSGQCGEGSAAAGSEPASEPATVSCRFRRSETPAKEGRVHKEVVIGMRRCQLQPKE